MPEPEIKPARRSLLDRFSVVWLVPIAALVISLAIAWQNYASRGPLIEIAFADAEGIRAGETELRYRDVPVGLVEDVTFSRGLNSVLVAVRIDQEIAPYVDAESEFWVVRPRVTAQGVTGLGTVLSGVYIQGSWDTEPGGLETHFVGMDAVPVARPDVPGLQIVLSSDTGEGLLQGTPILYRGVQVGAVSGLRLAEDGQTVLAEAFVEAPYDELISSSTRFWNASGFSFSLGPQGATLDVSSLAALVSGGVALGNLVSGGEQVEPGTVFHLYDGRDEALSSVFADPDTGDRVTVGFIFSGDVSGLTPGSDVEYQGIRVGEVVGVSGVIDEERFGDRRVRLLATAELAPGRLLVRAPGDDAAAELSAEETMALLSDLVESGVRAQLARASILVGGLKVVLAEEPDAEEAALEPDAEPFPLFPTTSSDIPQVANTVEGLIARVNELPIEEVLDGTSSLLQNVNALLGSEATQATPEEVLGLIADARQLIGSEDIQQVPSEVSALLTDVEAAVTDVRDILAEFRDAGAATALTEALAQAAPAMATLDRLLASAAPAVERLPALVEQLESAAADVATVARTTSELPLSELVISAAQTAEAARELVASESVRQVPAELSEVLSGLSATLEQVREAGLVARTSTAIASAGNAADSVTVIAGELPELIARIEAVAASVEALPLQPAVEAAERTLTSAADILASEAAQELPAELDAALAELRAVLGEIRSAGLVGQANETLAAAGETAAAIRGATAGVPELVSALEEFAATAAALPLEQLATDLESAVEAAQRAMILTNEILASESVRTLPSEINTALAELRLAVSEFRASDVVAQLEAALAEAGRAAAAVREATTGVPDLVASFDQLAETANTLPLERLATNLTAAVETAQQALASVDQLLASEGVAALPSELNSALGELRAVLSDFRGAGVIAQLDETLAEAGRAAGAVGEATAGVPEVVAGLGELTQRANQLPLERLTTDVADLAQAAEALLASEGAQQLPASLGATLDEVRAALEELREGGLVQAANQTLASTRDAAAAIEQASQSLPELAARLDSLADQAERTLAGYDEGSELTREAQNSLREVQAAARAVSALARQIERNPNSLILGR